ncbi:uncharacterized protein LOC143152403 isoform X2 [Ptiloglossa arizonensis]|uniref:uncharacterized protein LOC143152403 isoform X2 n=1 Tax=Ptiloglossa arizonensis TaxID=3350558 RepID=UPI003F9F80AB
MVSLTILLLLGCISVNILVQASINNYLSEKLKQTKAEIAKLYFQEETPVQRKFYNVQWNKRWQESLNKERPFIVNAFNRVLFVQGNRVVAFSIDTPLSNQTSLQEVILTRGDGSIKFLRTIVWKTIFYLLVCYETGSCCLYTGTDNFQLKHRQTIQHRGHPMDASFFARTNRLYLVVADNSGRFTVPSLIYHWRGTYMDVVAEVMTTAAVSVTTFKHKQSTIIIFAQNDKNVPGIGSVVYEFKETSPDRIQFLSTYNPVSVHHYNHAGYNFIFLMNEHGPSNLFWWDGQELLNWQKIFEIKAPSSVHAVNVNDDTFFLVGHQNVLQLYKFENASDWTLLTSKKLPDNETVIDVQVRIDKSTMIVMPVTVSLDNVYSIGSWELQIKEFPSEQSIGKADVLSKHLSKLVETLQRRKPLIEKAESSWSSLLPVNEDLNISESLVLSDLILESGTLENIDVFVSGDVVHPRELEQNFDTLLRDVDDILITSMNLLTRSNVNSFFGDIIVQDNAFIEKLKIDKMNVDFLNDIDIRANNDDSIEATKHLTPLHGKNITVHHLEIDSLCGIPFKYWATSNDTSRMEINLEADKIEFSNDTILLRSNISLTRLNVKTLNDVNITEFLDELFILHKNQKIRGNITYTNTLKIHNLTVQTLNGVSSESYMTTNTEQNFDEFFVKSLQVDHLIADSINGIPVSGAARISRKNTIKGKVEVTSMHVTDKLTIESDSILPITKRFQIYPNVTVSGDLKVRALNLDKYSKIFVNDEELQLSHLVENFWTKSSDQVIENDIAFENNLIIDELHAKYLNGFAEEEFLYTDATVVPEVFRNLHFENVHVDDTFFAEGGNNSLFDIAHESLTIRERLHLKHLRGNKLFVDVFNGLHVSDILNGNQPLSIPKNMNFLTIRAKQVNVDEFDFLFINGVDNATVFENPTNVRKDKKLDVSMIPVLRVENLLVDRINDIEMQKLTSLRNTTHLKNLVIDGDLTIEGDLRIERIDDAPAEIYLKNMAKMDIVFDTEKSFDELIVQDATMKFLHDRDMTNFFEGVLSKSTEQIVPGKFSFYKITSGNVVSSFINDRHTSKLTWIDVPMFLKGNVTFDDLYANNVLTKTLNGQDVNELYENLLDVPATKIKELKVSGNISWSVDSPNSSSLKYMFENALNKITDQVIYGDTVFKNDVSMTIASGGQLKNIDTIRDVVTDAVIDNEGVVEVAGTKVFKENLSINVLSVTNNIEISVINNVDILEFNNSVVRKDQNETITGLVIFLEEVAINELLVNDSIHDIPLTGLVLATDMLHCNVSFKHLVVRDVLLKNLDGVDFNEFVKNRVTIDGDHDILTDVQFNDIIDVTGYANVTRINGINPSDLVLDEMEEMQYISGTKTFEEDVVVNGNIYASLVNGMNISSKYSTGVQNDENVEIIGNLTFESQVKVPENVFVSKLVNGMNLHTVLDDTRTRTHETVQTFLQNKTKMEDSVAQSSLISEKLKNTFSYLETEETLKIQVPNIKTVGVVYYEGITKLNMFGEEPGPVCGLPRNCFCPTEYVAELEKDDCRVWRTNGSTIVRNYHELHSTFGINVITNTVSSSPECTLNRSENEFTQISWMKSRTIETGDVLANVKETSSTIRGFIKDAEVFMVHNRIYCFRDIGNTLRCIESVTSYRFCNL